MFVVADIMGETNTSSDEPEWKAIGNGNVTQSNYIKVAAITGASSGIGRASALELARQGYELLLCARSADKLDKVKQEVQASGGAVHIFQCDVSVPAQVREMASFAASQWDHLDLLFNNAGTGDALALEDTSDDQWTNMIGSSLSGTFYCCREFLPMLRNAKSAMVINNTSVAAHRGFPNFSAYSAAKGGVASFSRALREELRSDGIRVTALASGATDSPFWDKLAGEWDRSRMMTCDSVGKFIAYIAAMPTCAQLEEVLLMPSGGAL